MNDSLIGQRMKILRGELTQQELGEKMRQRGFKWSQATVWDVERGKRPLRLSEAVAVAEILQASHILLVSESGGTANDYARGFEAGVESIKSAISQLKVRP